MTFKTSGPGITLSLFMAMTGCVAGQGGPSTESEGASAAITAAPSSVTVDGYTVDVETDYIPHVVECENGEAPLEALKAQAVAARTTLAYFLQNNPGSAVEDSQNFQVYGCGKTVQQADREAASATSGQIIYSNGTLIDAFYVDGAVTDSSCDPSGYDDGTQEDVTGCSSTDQNGNPYCPRAAGTGSSLGDTSNPANVGCMGQNLASCLATTRPSYTYVNILKFFYGNQITITGSSSSSSSSGPVSTAYPGGGTTSPPAHGAYCWSSTFQKYFTPSECVQSSSDHAWYQCSASGNWAALTSTNTGPDGACTSSRAL